MQISDFWKTFLIATQYGGAIVSFLLNSVLILLIVFRSPVNLGSYKYLLLYIVIFQIAYSLLDVITEPTILSCGPAFFVFRNFKDSMLGREESFFLVVVYCGFFGFSIALFAIHYIYRYGVADNKFRETYLTGHNLTFLFLIPVAIGTTWAAFCYLFFHFDSSTDLFARNAILETYDTRIEDTSYVIARFYRLDKHNELQPDLNVFFVIACMWSLVISSVVCVFYFGIKCYLRLTQVLPSSQLASKSAKSIQQQLFLALVVQTIIPVVLMYIPIGILFLFPMLNLDVGILGSSLAATIAIYPAIDPLPTMFIVKNYRDTLLCRICWKKSSEPTPGIQLQPIA